MKKVLILGFSRSGVASFKLLKDEYEIDIFEEKKIDSIYKAITYQELRKKLPLYDLVIRSPGIKSTSKIYNLAMMLGKEVISELELSSRYLKTKEVISISGSVGKSTLATLIYEILKTKYTVHLLSNIGKPLGEEVLKIKKKDIVVLEVSSFQAENTSTLKSKYLLYTNFLKNHRDAVKNYDYYFASKKRLAFNAKHLFYNKSDKKYFERPSEEIDFSVSKGCIKYRDKVFIKEEELYLKGDYNLKHLCMALQIGYKYHVSLKKMKEIIKGFKPLKYHLEIVKKINNTRIINDAKATTIDATNYALKTFNSPKRIIILGGINKSGSFKRLMIKGDDLIYTFGRDGKTIAKDLKGVYFETLKEVITEIKNDNLQAFSEIIFSPGCSSFDQYQNYLMRGKEFNLLMGVDDDLN